MSKNSKDILEEDLPKFIKFYIAKFFRDMDVKRILDLSCGSSRPRLFLADIGFDVYGMDFFEEGIKSARSMFERLPYEDNFFDALISIRSLHHGTIENIRKAIQEFQRVLKLGGFIFITVIEHIPDELRRKYKMIAPQTYISLEGKERGVIYYVFTQDLLLYEFRQFKIHRIWIAPGPIEWETYYCLLGELTTHLNISHNNLKNVPIKSKL